MEIEWTLIGLNVCLFLFLFCLKVINEDLHKQHMIRKQFTLEYTDANINEEIIRSQLSTAREKQDCSVQLLLY